ncbi:MAG: glycoside hydrolase family 3 C-terminal domain-containing protein [Halothermotrichaceae bacterium]
MNDIKEKILKMTLEEKAALCSGANFWKTKEIGSVNIPSIMMADGPHGLRVVDESTGMGNSRPATCFPTASALASSWDRELIGKIGKALAAECKDQGVDILLGPGVNIKRTPLCGRNFEYFSEDPYLAGELAVSYVDNVQKKGVGTSLKHYAANNQEHKRFYVNSIIDERTLREIYLPAFEKIVKECQPWTVMCAYNRINGIFGSENQYLLTDILREEWGFEGLVVSDWGAVHNRVKGITAGLDLEMPGTSPLNDQKLIDAVKTGQLSEKVLDKTCERILKIVFKVVEETKKADDKNHVNYQENHTLARKAAAESMVLLKNEDNILPLDTDDIDTLAVIGKMALEPRYEGGGSSKVNAVKVDIPLEEIKKLANRKISINYTDGYTMKDKLDMSLLEEAIELAEKVDRVIIFAGTTEEIESEGYDRKDLCLPENQVELIKAVTEVQPNTVVALNNGSAVDMSSWIDKVPALLECWLTGQGSGGAAADILFGKVNPSGKLAETFPVKLEDTPAYLNYPGQAGEVRYGEGLYVGYRYYDKKGIEPLYPFGYGLSYTEFAYNNLKIKELDGSDNGLLRVEVTISNIGKMKGKEIVQLYIKPEKASIDRPEKELKGFKKVELEIGEDKTVCFTLSRRDFAYYDVELNKWLAENGTYQILVGKSSEQIILSQPYNLKSGEEKKLSLSALIPPIEWIEDSEARKILENVLTDEQIEKIEDTECKINGRYSLYVTDKPIYRLAAFSRGEISREQVEEILNRIK